MDKEEIKYNLTMELLKQYSAIAAQEKMKVTTAQRIVVVVNELYENIIK